MSTNIESAPQLVRTSSNVSGINVSGMKHVVSSLTPSHSRRALGPQGRVVGREMAQPSHPAHPAIIPYTIACGGLNSARASDLTKSNQRAQHCRISKLRSLQQGRLTICCDADAAQKGARPSGSLLDKRATDPCKEGPVSYSHPSSSPS